MSNQVRSPMRGKLYAIVAISLAMCLYAIPCFAAGETDVLPYEKGMEVFYDSMTGPVPFVISLVGIIGCGAMLIFGGEISGFLRTMVFIILVVAVIVQAGSVVTMLGGKWGTKAQGVGRVGPYQRDVDVVVGTYLRKTVA
ncbi:TrbC/VirB2 family protein [Dyella sp. 333MFSha]|uniref:TrbC/VirB2 family protein n=1 Tax=Dyella sp. 333MFSha TaxID=1798240 RepID=UPI0008900FB0|nr:TrbC/VirB2 family protein [Dyella sp. 333MFSha]SDG18850.1 type IV secretion system protein VirB2 [Dyella sp. 333MFSha]